MIVDREPASEADTADAGVAAARFPRAALPCVPVVRSTGSGGENLEPLDCVGGPVLTGSGVGETRAGVGAAKYRLLPPAPRALAGGATPPDDPTGPAGSELAAALWPHPMLAACAPL